MLKEKELQPLAIIKVSSAHDLRRSQGFVKEVTQHRVSPVGLLENEFRHREPQGFFLEVD